MPLRVCAVTMTAARESPSTLFALTIIPECQRRDTPRTTTRACRFAFSPTLFLTLLCFYSPTRIILIVPADTHCCLSLSISRRGQRRGEKFCRGDSLFILRFVLFGVHRTMRSDEGFPRFAPLLVTGKFMLLLIIDTVRTSPRRLCTSQNKK